MPRQAKLLSLNTALIGFPDTAERFGASKKAWKSYVSL
jgi:hypothetical protein